MQDVGAARRRSAGSAVGAGRDRLPADRLQLLRSARMLSYLADWAALLVRWLHVIAGIAWIGASFYFVWLDNHLQPPSPTTTARAGVAGELWAVHGGGFYHIAQISASRRRSCRRPLHWFYWEAYTTWLSGFALLCLLYFCAAEAYLIDPSRRRAEPPPQAIAISIGVPAPAAGSSTTRCAARLGPQTGALARAHCGRAAARRPGACAMCSAAAARSCMFGAIARHAHGGQRAVRDHSRASGSWCAPSSRAANPTPRRACAGKQRSVHNTYFTLPVLFMMISNHYAMTYGARHNWLVLIAIALPGPASRVVRRAPQGAEARRRLLDAAGAARRADARGVGVALAPPQGAGSAGARAAGAPADGTHVQLIIEQRCVPCHAAPTQAGFNAPPNGIVLQNIDQVRAHLPQVQQQLAMRAMPLGNLTGMTDEERSTVLTWIGRGARP